MTPLTLYNTRTKTSEPFRPADPAHITIYTCGPTVYDDAHIGNFRAFLAADLLRRTLESPLCTVLCDNGDEHTDVRNVTHVMNITDVGHMTDDANADGAGQDKMELAAQRLKDAKKAGTLHTDADLDPNDPAAVARFYTDRFKQDAKKLGLKVVQDAERAAKEDPQLENHFLPRATHHVDDMKRVIAALLDQGNAYTAGAPGARAVYFDVSTFPHYGELSGNTLDKLQSGAGGRVTTTTQSEKHNPADFLLWKEDPTHTMKWPAPDHPQCKEWDQGYPGWHIECTAMALKRLVDTDIDKTKGRTIDIHTGGEDNIFPHHECEIAQSRAFTGADHFAHHWFHPRFLLVDGTKMSKSKGTMHTLRDLEAMGHDPAAVRLELIKTHYRANADFSLQGLKDSAKRIRRLRDHAKALSSMIQHGDEIGLTSLGHTQLDKFADALHDDLNVAEAVSAASAMVYYGYTAFESSQEASDDNLFELRKERMRTTYEEHIERGMLPESPESPHECLDTIHNDESSDNKKTLAALHLIDNILGVIFRPLPKSQDTNIARYTQGVEPSEAIESLLQQRAEAKKNKDFATADQIRDQLAAMNLAIADKPGGKVEISRATPKE